MAQAACTESDFVSIFERFGAAETARRLGVGERRVQSRRVRLERKLGRAIVSPHSNVERKVPANPARVLVDIEDGIALVGSDAHYWPGDPSCAHRALVAFAKALNPDLIVMNGDSLDAASISRHPPIGWEKSPTVAEEIEVVKERHDEIAEASPDSQLVWTLGNHDARFETRLAQVAPEYAEIKGIHLKDHFPEWEPAWSCWVNDSVVIKHRFKGGVHAPHNNTVNAGKTMVTGHLHSQKVTPFTDYNGTRWGVDTGCLADPAGRQFDYIEDNPRNWVSGFALFTFVGGKLLPPELISVWDHKNVAFRGHLIEV